MAERLKLSANQRTAFAAAVALECGRSLDSLNISKSTALRAASETRKRKSETCIESFIPPGHCIVHWDSKLFINESSEREDRLAILVSGYPNMEKLLSVQKIENSTGLSQATSVYEVLRKWNLLANVLGVSFDTTASNSGWKRGSCKLLEELMEKKLLWFACRHHVAERILCAVYEVIFGSSKSPEYDQFKDFRDSKWKIVNTKSAYNVLEIKSRFQKSLKDENVEFLGRCLSRRESFPRDDYKEVAETTLMLLGASTERIKWHKPGAIHRARWMAIVLYTNKMYAFSTQTNYDKNFIDKLRRICLFNTLIYAKYWLSCSNPVDSPENDLKLYQILTQYKKEDNEVAEAALKAFKNHLWYLTEEMAPLSLFGSLNPNDKNKIAKVLINYPPPKEYIHGQPVFPNLMEGTKLFQLIGANSWYLFKCLGLKCDWIFKPALKWEEDNEYNKAKDIISSFRVVNDTAERGIHLVQEFYSACKDEKEFQGLLQIVEENRKLLPVLTKQSLKLFK